MYLQYVQDYERQYKNNVNPNKNTSALEDAIRLTYTILETRFSNELKRYNHDPERAYGKYNSKQILNDLRLYIEEFILLDKPQHNINYYKQVRKHMRRIVNELFQVEQWTY